MEAALDHLRATGFDVRDDDVQRLTPLIWEHIELHGRYAFPEDQLPAGTLRALRTRRSLRNPTSDPSPNSVPLLLTSRVGERDKVWEFTLPRPVVPTPA
ncbi:MAG: hypothetical protein QOH66_1502 [Actinomycetota bacterium]|jgi:hypothetical protein|nr:hypothetical protein [Actinomycetota bacterium]